VPTVVDAATYYDDGMLRHDIYAMIATEIIALASVNPPVALIVHGHPLFLVSAAELLIEQAKDRGLRAVAVPAVSSFDVIMCVLGKDLAYGVQLFDASSFLINGWEVSPKCPSLFFQIATTLNPAVVREPDTHALAPLQRALLARFPPDHKCAAIYVPTSFLDEPVIHWLRLEALLDDDLELWRRPTLYVPELPTPRPAR
jgi:hypothetical protein